MGAEGRWGSIPHASAVAREGPVVGRRSRKPVHRKVSDSTSPRASGEDESAVVPSLVATQCAPQGIPFDSVFLRRPRRRRSMVSPRSVPVSQGVRFPPSAPCPDLEKRSGLSFARYPCSTASAGTSCSRARHVIGTSPGRFLFCPLVETSGGSTRLSVFTDVQRRLEAEHRSASVVWTVTLFLAHDATAAADPGLPIGRRCRAIPTR